MFKKILKKIAQKIWPLSNNALMTLNEVPMPHIGDAGREIEISDELNEWIKRTTKALQELVEDME